ncbi:MAG: DegV family protein [Anaerolineae bacterium]|nr:DegV family protein [Anaerolineae bacterium]
MTIRIVTDSTCDLPPQIIAQNNIAVIPLLINIASKEFQDGVDLSRQEFYQRLPAIKPAPTTAVPGSQVFRQVYERLAAEGASEILSIHVSESLSAVVNVARIAAQETTTVPVTVFDSRQLSLGLGFQALAAAQTAAAGFSISQIISLLKAQIARTHVFAALDTLEFLRRSGRVNLAVSTFGSILHVKPFLKLYDGVTTTERVRTRKNAHKRLEELLEQYAPYEKVALLHANAAEQARAVLRQVSSLLPPGEIWFEEINPIIGAHLGPGVIGFACISKNSSEGKHDLS